MRPSSRRMCSRTCRYCSRRCSLRTESAESLRRDATPLLGSLWNRKTEKRRDRGGERSAKERQWASQTAAYAKVIEREELETEKKRKLGQWVRGESEIKTAQLYITDTHMHEEAQLWARMHWTETRTLIWSDIIDCTVCVCACSYIYVLYSTGSSKALQLHQMRKHESRQNIMQCRQYQ